MIHLRRLLIPLAASFAFGALAAQPAAPLIKPIEAQPLTSALKTFAQTTGLQLVYVSDIALGLKSNGAPAGLSAEQTLNELLSGTGLTFEFVNDRTVSIRPRSGAAARPKVSREHSLDSANLALAQADMRNASVPDNAQQTSEGNNGGGAQEQDQRGVPEILVKGSKIQNMDIRRSREDAQPYVVFDRDTIEKSGATNLEDFFKNRLTMNAVGTTNAMGASAFGTVGVSNLRGLGANQTLILVDGHRVARAPIGFLDQTDVNGIPLAAIERVEVLPTTASGIYGGGATGGVINVILRRDYAGVEAKLSYEDSFHGDVGRPRADVSAGLNLEDGKTNVLLAGSYSQANALLLRERSEFLQRGYRRVIANTGDPLSINVSGIIPPLGATTNIYSADGSPLFGPGTPSHTSVPVGYAGGGGLAPLQANAGRYNLDLSDTAQSNGGNSGLINNVGYSNWSMNVRRQFSERVSAFIDLSASKQQGEFANSAYDLGFFTVSATAPNNPFGQDIYVRVPTRAGEQELNVDTTGRRAVGGAIVQLPGRWQAGADYTWDRSRLGGKLPGLTTGAEEDAVFNGVIDVLRDTQAYPLNLQQFVEPRITMFPRDSILKNALLRAAGPLFDLPAGPLTLSSQLEWRQETIGSSRTITSPTLSFFSPERDQTVKAAYLELKVPFFSAQNRRAGAEELELQVAGRYDDYVLNGATTSIIEGSNTPILTASQKLSSSNPTVAVRYSPVRDVVLRGSYGTGFLPPSLNQLTRTLQALSLYTVNDPRRGGTSVSVPIISGGNAGLRPESSESWSAGMILTPRFAPNLRLSVDYVRIEKTDNIANLTQQQVVDNENLFPQRVERAPVAGGDPYGVGVITRIDVSSVNIAQAFVEAYDLALDYDWEIQGRGQFRFFVLGTRTTKFKNQIAPTLPVVDNLGVFYSRPQKWKANGGVNWELRNWKAGWSVNYFDSYLVSTSLATRQRQGNGGRVESQMYHDVFASYRFGGSAGGGIGDIGSLLSDLEITAGIKNLFDKLPPFDATSNFNNYVSPLGDWRLRTYAISLQKTF